MLMQLDSFAHVCEDIGRQLLTYGRVHSLITSCTFIHAGVAVMLLPPSPLCFSVFLLHVHFVDMFIQVDA